MKATSHIHDGIAFRVKEMTTKSDDPDVINKINEFNDANEKYQMRKKIFNANSRTKDKGYIRKPQDDIAIDMMNAQLRDIGKINKTAGAFGKGNGLKKAGGQRGS